MSQKSRKSLSTEIKSLTNSLIDKVTYWAVLDSQKEEIFDEIEILPNPQSWTKTNKVKLVKEDKTH